MAKIVLENIQKKYDKGEIAVNDFNLEIDDQEFIVFVGPSGCGKSTTLRMIAGLEDITEGNFIVDGQRMNDVAPKNRNIAMVFQNYALYPHLNVFDNIAFGLKLRKVPKTEIKKKVQEAAEMLGLESYLYRKPKELSGGQRQRVALGRAIVREPKLFLLDEPLSNLDAKLRVQMRSEISKLHRRLKTTTIYVTHDQTEAMTMASRLVVMKDGHIQQIGTAKEVYDFPENIFVGGFLGSPAMNFIPGRLEGQYFVVDDIQIPVSSETLSYLNAQGYNGKEITLGIRPEHIHDDQDSSIHAKVDTVELLGSESIVYAYIKNHIIFFRTDVNHRYVTDQAIQLHFDVNKIHFFDSETGIRIRENN
ncbi:sn-glycerol-3-phosphate ABC transporter ATP-binding protein UgpC [Metabacillus fastidiosus]|uniref:ABC transporter ATP-binding protein n=1 Tax=Metabacillus fastidiosus TaxID=1458 RepID=UPI002E1A2F95|nr:sn-glycerol-3-phosphate ABC transporter ATP-binding protein UgpC [Metabacillus fastidiosus]MED4455144.1 sn-glycerol-3-phosphate ABC transporter ATP-binding protein UgpC [Metabacillus fastidiosus]